MNQQIEELVPRKNKQNKEILRHTNRRKEKIKINAIRKLKVEITTDITKVQKITSSYYNKFYSSKMENLEEIGRFLDM